MKIILYSLLLVIGTISGYHNKFADAQNTTGVSQDVKADMSDLKKMRGGSFRMWVAVSMINGVNKQRVYFWNPNRVRTDTTGLGNGFIVIPDATINGVTNTGTGVWDSVNFDYRINNIAGLQSALDAKATGASVNAEKTRAITREDSLRNAINSKTFTETDPLYTANGVPKTRTVATGYGVAGGGDLSANRTLIADTASATGLVSKARLTASLTGVVRNVQLGGGTANFTTAVLSIGGTNAVTVPLNTTYSDTNYQITMPMIFGTGGLQLLGTSFDIVSVVKNTTNVVVTLRNRALLGVAVSGSIDIESIKVIQ